MIGNIIYLFDTMFSGLVVDKAVFEMGAVVRLNSLRCVMFLQDFHITTMN